MASRAEGKPEPVQEFFSIGDVCELTELKPHVLRYWESQFRFLRVIACISDARSS
jgi:hypothetical protein